MCAKISETVLLSIVLKVWSGRACVEYEENDTSQNSKVEINVIFIDM